MPPRAVELVLAGVAVAADEVVAAGVGDQPDEPVRLRTEGRDSEAAWKTAPATCSGRRRVRGKTAQAASCPASDRRLSARAVEAEDLGGGDDADQPVQVVTVARSRRPAAIRPGGSSPAAGRSSTGSASGRPKSRAQTRLTVARAKLGLRGSVTQAGELLARAARPRPELGEERHARLDRRRLLGLAVQRLVRAFSVADAAQVRVNLAEEGGQAAEVGLLPGLERVVVALGAIEPDAQERPRHPRRQPFRRRAARSPR